MIGIFDSGFGGLTALREWDRILPAYDVVFLGDSARTPYGSRSVETITKFAAQGVSWLFENGAEVVLIACNTASADALKFLQETQPERTILGVVTPAAEEALQASRSGRIGIIGTRGTILAKAYERELQRLDTQKHRLGVRTFEQGLKTYAVAAPLLVPLVEEGWNERPETRTILEEYLLPLKEANVDTLILGCTHYPILEPYFREQMQTGCQIINSGAALSRNFAEYLKRHPEIEARLGKTGKRRFFTTDCPKRFQELGSNFLGRRIETESVSKVDLV